MRRLTDVDWPNWSPRDRATLLFVVKDGQVLLIRKKRGLGAGKINAPGGRLEPGETAAAAAVREVEEEVRVTPLGPVELGQLSFQFTDGYSLFCHVFRAGDCRGQAAATAEADPVWTALDHIPFAEMWADDVLWVPHLLAGRRFAGRFIFDGDALLDHQLEVEDAPAPGRT
jgi:8-oxo-dGTP diphosphatase